jgi:hypothetical protein
MCNETICFEDAERVTLPGSDIDLYFGYLDGRRWSCMIADNRYADRIGHMHFPAADPAIVAMLGLAT